MLQACVECFFAALTHEYCESVCETIMEIYNEQSWYIPADPNDIQAILVADAVYCAFGLAAFHLFDEIDFNHWLTGTLIRQLRINHPNYKILKHRIIWLIGMLSQTPFNIAFLMFPCFTNSPFISLPLPFKVDGLWCA
jgi:hypothetical protein